MTKERELLRRALSWMPLDRALDLQKEITDFLAAEKEAEPVGYVYTDNGTKLKHGAIDDHSLENGTPLYTRPSPARKPMTEEEIVRLGIETVSIEPGVSGGYFLPVTFARAIEKHHFGIGGDDE